MPVFGTIGGGAIQQPNEVSDCAIGQLNNVRRIRIALQESQKFALAVGSGPKTLLSCLQGGGNEGIYSMS